MELYKIESLENPNVCTIAVNPKEYFEKFKNSTIKRMKRKKLSKKGYKLKILIW